MRLSPVAKHLLAPSADTLLFAMKGVIAVALALSIAFYLQLERPFWAVIAAMMLQGRPQMGLVLEKSLLLVAGTVCGGGIAFFVLESFVHHPTWIVLSLAAVAFICTYYGSAHRHVNYSYGLALVPVTTAIVTLLAGADTAHITSSSIFEIFISRLSEVSVGALSASLCSTLIFPSRISDTLEKEMKSVTINTLQTLAQAFDTSMSIQAIRIRKQGLVTSITKVFDESRAASLEGDNRAIQVVARECLQLSILIQSIVRIRQRMGRTHTSTFRALSIRLNDLAQHLKELPPAELKAIRLNSLLANVAKLSVHPSQLDPEFARLLAKLDLKIDHLLVTENNVLRHSSEIRPRFTHDLIGNGLVALRVATYVIASSSFWIFSGGTSSQVMMIIIPLLFAQLFSSVPNPSLVTMKLFIGACMALPVGAFWGLNLLSYGTGNLEVLYLVLLPPLYVALMAMTHPVSAPYSIAFCFTYVLMVQPDNRMTFDFYNSLSLGLGVITGLSILYACIMLVPKANPAYAQLNALRFLRKEAKKLSLGKSDPASFDSVSIGAIVHIAKVSTNRGRGRLTLARAMDTHTNHIGNDTGSHPQPAPLKNSER